MNPVFARMVNRHQQKRNEQASKQEQVMKALSSMSPEQKEKFKSYFPMIKNLASKLGVSQEQINTSFEQLQSRI